MNPLNSLLAHYHSLFKDKQKENNLIIETIKKQTNLTISSDQIKIINNILFLKIKAKPKLEIILRKEGVINQLNSVGIKVSDLK